MSHFERLVGLLEDIGLTKAEDEDAVRNPWSAGDQEYAVAGPDEDGLQHVFIGRGKGYSGFYCTFAFDAEGKYVAHACGE